MLADSPPKMAKYKQSSHSPLPPACHWFCQYYSVRVKLDNEVQRKCSFHCHDVQQLIPQPSETLVFCDHPADNYAVFLVPYDLHIFAYLLGQNFSVMEVISGDSGLPADAFHSVICSQKLLGVLPFAKTCTVFRIGKNLPRIPKPKVTPDTKQDESTLPIMLFVFYRKKYTHPG